MAEATFRAPVRSSGRGGGGHLVDIPPEVIEALGGQGSGRSRIPVTATFDGVPYRGSIVRMGGGAVLGVQKAIMSETGVSVGDTLTVVVRNDDAPREVEVPDDLAEALRRSDEARAVFDGLSFSHRREYVDSIREAKRPETRARRVERTIQALLERSGG
jgi:antitoxin component of MazEF toxin-antitoxin module